MKLDPSLDTTVNGYVLINPDLSKQSVPITPSSCNETRRTEVPHLLLCSSRQRVHKSAQVPIASRRLDTAVFETVMAASSENMAIPSGTALHAQAMSRHNLCKNIVLTHGANLLKMLCLSAQKVTGNGSPHQRAPTSGVKESCTHADCPIREDTEQ